MIMNAVNYTGNEKKLVDKYLESKIQSPDIWECDEYAPVRKRIKDHYLFEQNYTCAFCQQKHRVKHNRVWDVEHIISKTGHPQFLFEPKNLCISCPDCNIEKGEKGVLDRENRVKFTDKSEAYKIVHPHFDKYEEHIKVLVKGKLYQFKTKKGRKTIQTYGLDRFMEDAGRNKVSNHNTEIKELLTSLLYSEDSNEHKKLEDRLLRNLILKRSPDIGNDNVVAILKSINN